MWSRISPTAFSTGYKLVVVPDEAVGATNGVLLKVYGALWGASLGSWFPWGRAHRRPVRFYSEFEEGQLRYGNTLMRKEVNETSDIDSRLLEARYDITSAAHHLRMPRSTLAAWTQGQGTFKRVLELPQSGYLSFVNLTEAFVLFAMRRRYNITLPRVREAISYVEKKMGYEHPLAFQAFQTDYVDLFIETAMGSLNVSRGGQTGIASVTRDLGRIEWRNDRPIALFPIPSNRSDETPRPIRISPLVAFGKPVLTGTRIPTLVVFNRFSGGESVQELADDFGVSANAVEEAVRAESAPTAA